nr:hypothetical protein [Kiritimatiellia bacterium]
WIRIYPIPFRKLDYTQKYSKYQWVEMDLVKNDSDFRPESFRPFDIDAEDFITFGDKIGTENKWAERKRIVLHNVYEDLTKLIADAKDNKKHTSLAIFKPTVIKNFIVEPTEREWNKSQLAALKQGKLFEQEKSFEVVRKLPYKFSYVFEDCNGRESTLMNEDWEVGALYWNCLKRHNGNEEAARNDVKKKYLDDFAKTKDLYFFLGTTKLNHLRAPNPFVIIGTFHPMPDNQLSLEL